MKSALTKIQGARSAIMALVLLAEVVSRQLGYETGPVFAIAKGFFSTIGWEQSDAVAMLGVPPETLAAAGITIYVAGARLVAWAKAPKAAPIPDKPPVV